MIDRVVVAFDGSELSREAFAYALALAEAAGRGKPVGVHVVHAIEPDAPVMMAGDPALVDPTPLIEQREAERREEQAWAEREFAAMGRAAGDRGIELTTSLEIGPLLETLCDLSSAHDLIAVGRKGRFARSGLGSTTAALIRNAPCPVLVVSGSAKPIERVLAVYDGSRVSKRAVAEAEEFADASGLPLVVLASAGHGHDLEEAVERARQDAPGATVTALGESEQRDESALIEHALGDDGHALLFLGAYPDSMLQRLLFGGATERVLSRLGAPVALVR